MHLLLFLKSQLLLEETLEHVYAMDCYESASFRYKEERGILRRLWFSPLFSDLPTKKKKKKRDWGWRIRAEEVTGSQRLKSSSIPFSLEWELYMRRTLASSLSLSRRARKTVVLEFSARKSDGVRNETFRNFCGTSRSASDGPVL